MIIIKADCWHWSSNRIVSAVPNDAAAVCACAEPVTTPPPLQVWTWRWRRSEGWWTGRWASCPRPSAAAGRRPPLRPPPPPGNTWWPWRGTISPSRASVSPGVCVCVCYVNDESMNCLVSEPDDIWTDILIIEAAELQTEQPEKWFKGTVRSNTPVIISQSRSILKQLETQKRPRIK